MRVQEYVDQIEFKLIDLQDLYIMGIIDLDELHEMVDNTVSSKKLEKRFPNHKEREMAENLISAILNVYNFS